MDAVSSTVFGRPRHSAADPITVRAATSLLSWGLETLIRFCQFLRLFIWLAMRLSIALPLKSFADGPMAVVTPRSCWA